MPRLSPVDTAFFALETEQRPMNVGVLVVLGPPPGARGRFAGRLLAAMRKVPVGPPFNYVLRKAALTGALTLEAGGKVDTARHVFRHRLPRGTQLPALLDRVCDLHVELLDRSMPLWQAHVFEGLPDRRIALYFKTHHGLIDGLGFIRIVTGTVSHSPHSRAPQAIWRGLPHAQPGGVPADGGSPAGQLLASALRARRTANDMLRLIWHQGLRDLGVGRGLVAPFVTTPDVLRTEPSPHRIMAHCSVSLPRVRRIARQHAAKINDVMLTVLDIAMNHYLAGRGTPPDRPLVADIPVALVDHGGTGNRITILQVPMGQPAARPALRLREVVRETREMKDELRSISGDALMLYSIVQHALAGAIESLHLGRLPMLANTVVSNPAGLTEPAYFNGAPVELALPVSVVAHHQVLNTTITTYVDRLHVTFIALREAMPDLQKLADLTAAALGELARDLAREPREAGGVARRKSARHRTARVALQRPPSRAPTAAQAT